MRRHGFTLLEVLVAMTILALLATMVYTGFSQASRNKKRLEAQNDFYQEVTLTLERMTRELASAFVSTHINPSVQLQTRLSIFAGKSRANRDRVDFTSFAHRRVRANEKASDQAELSYFVTDDPEGEGLVLARREQSPIDDEPQRGGASTILLRGVESFELRYLDPLSNEWLREWDTTQATGQMNRLPLQVKIILKMQDPFNERKTRTFGTIATPMLRWGLNHAAYNP